MGATLTGGTASYVAEATTRDGAAVVLKITLPAATDGATGFDAAVRTFTLADGRGCPRLIAHDAERSALLVERLGPNLDSLGLPVARQLEDHLRHGAADVGTGAVGHAVADQRGESAVAGRLHRDGLGVT